MGSVKLPARLLPAATLHHALLVLFLCSISFGCAFVSVEDQLVSAKVDGSVIRTAGDCGETFSTPGGAAAVVSDEGLDPDHIAILDWNIYKEQRHGWADDFLRFSKGKNIILLQEALLSDELQKLLQQEKLYWNLNSGFSYKGMDTGVLAASTLDSLDSCGMRYREPVVGLPKTILVSRYVITGSAQKLAVANVHGVNITLGIEAYREQFLALKKLLQSHRGPLVIAGDFNNWNDRRTAVIDRLVEDLALTLLVFEDEGRTTFFGQPVDHILYRGLEPVSLLVHSVTSSDHNPISVTFRLAPEPSLRQHR